MKAQFFILGAVLVCALFLIGLPFYGPEARSGKGDLKFVSENIEMELPRAFNLGMKSGSGTQNLASFSIFVKNSILQQSKQLRLFWVVAETGESDLVVTAGNFMGKETNPIITVDGSQWEFNIEDGEMQSRIFSGIPDRFDIEINFEGKAKTTQWVRNKANLYGFIEIKRGNDISIREVES